MCQRRPSRRAVARRAVRCDVSLVWWCAAAIRCAVPHVCRGVVVVCGGAAPLLGARPPPRARRHRHQGAIPIHVMTLPSPEAVRPVRVEVTQLCVAPRNRDPGVWCGMAS